MWPWLLTVITWLFISQIHENLTEYLLCLEWCIRHGSRKQDKVPAFMMLTCLGTMVIVYKQLLCMGLFSWLRSWKQSGEVSCGLYDLPFKRKGGLVHALLMVTLINGSKYDSNLDLLTWSPALSPAHHRLLFLMLPLWTKMQCRGHVHMAGCLEGGSSASSSGHKHTFYLELLCGAALRAALLTTSTLWHSRGDFLLPVNYHLNLSRREKAPLTSYFKI